MKAKKLLFLKMEISLSKGKCKMHNKQINGFSKEFSLGKEVCKALEVLGYNEAMPVQRKVIPHVLEGKDLIVQSQTGSGKTAAFGIPIVEKLSVVENLPQVLVLTPTRELAVQVCEEIAAIGRYKKIRCLPIYGKQPLEVQIRQLKQRVHVAVGTPGRVADLINRRNLVLDQIKYLVIDEADELLKRGFWEEVEGIIQKLPIERTTLLFSATMPQQIEAICSEHMINPLRIELESTQEPIDQIKQIGYEMTEDSKYLMLTKLFTDLDPESCMIFCNTREKADFVVNKMKNVGYDCKVLHGGIAQKDRLRAITAFKNKEITYLVATDLAARGIHVDRLDLVVNYDVPTDNENYVHRIGRTGRVGEEGRAVSFISMVDKERWLEVQGFIGYTVPTGDTKLLEKIEAARPTRKAKVHEHANLIHPSKNNSHENELSNGQLNEASNKPANGHLNEPSKGQLNEPSKGHSNEPSNEQLHEVYLKTKVTRHNDITRIRINAGKTKKMRASDVLGAVSNLGGISSEDIGIIDIQETCTYIEIFNNKGQIVLDTLPKVKVKGKDVTVKRI